MSELQMEKSEQYWENSIICQHGHYFLLQLCLFFLQCVSM